MSSWGVRPFGGRAVSLSGAVAIRLSARFVVLSSALGVVEYTEEVLVLSDEFRELKKTFAVNVQLVLKGGCILYQWYMNVTPVKISQEHLRCVHWTRAPNEARGHHLVPDLMYGTLQRPSRLISVSRRISQGLCLAYGLRAGFVCAEGTMTGSVVEVSCEGDCCTDSPRGQWMMCACQVS